MIRLAALLLCLAVPRAGAVAVPGLEQPVEVIRDRWGVPHIYAQNTHDLFFAQGYMAAKDRLWQIDLWRRVGTGRLAEALGPRMLARDRLARAVRFRGDWKAEWTSYGPDTEAIATAFTEGINAYIRSLGDRWPREFRLAGYAPGLWEPRDVAARMAGLIMTRNLVREVARARDARQFGLEMLQRYMRPEPEIPLEVPGGLDLADITGEVLREYNQAAGAVRFPGQGSNNWVVDGSMTATGKPLLASDPHRPVQLPSLRKTVHLVAPGWNAIGAGEPALPGIALGHNERIGFGFTIVGIDQQDLFVERLNPADPDEYRYRGAWRKVEIERQAVAVRGRSAPETVELRYTVHGPVLHLDGARHRAYVLRWVGSEPGTAGYLAAVSLMRARDWNGFLAAVERYKVPSENLVYADVEGNIGWQPAGLAPIRKKGSGLFPVPGHTGEYEWSGFRKMSELPRSYNPAEHFLATANHNILPAGYTIPLAYEWAPPFRIERVREMLAGGRKFTVADFERMQQDVNSVPARRFQAVLRRWDAPERAREARSALLAWDARLNVDSAPSLIYEAWMAKLPAALFGGLGPRVGLEAVLRQLESRADGNALTAAFDSAIARLEKDYGQDRTKWTWGRAHGIRFSHPVPGMPGAGIFPRPGDAHTVNSTSGPGFQQTNGASYRQILDLSDWDKSVMTNTPGESGDPASPHYADLARDWAAGRYHPMPFTRKAVEAVASERITLVPATP